MAAAMGAAVAAGGPLAAYAGDPIPLSPWKGPLYGSDVCTSKPLFYFIAPLCDCHIATVPCSDPDHRLGRPHHYPEHPAASHSAGPRSPQDGVSEFYSLSVGYQ